MINFKSVTTLIETGTKLSKYEEGDVDLLVLQQRICKISRTLLEESKDKYFVRYIAKRERKLYETSYLYSI